MTSIRTYLTQFDCWRLFNFFFLNLDLNIVLYCWGFCFTSIFFPLGLFFFQYDHFLTDNMIHRRTWISRPTPLRTDTIKTKQKIRKKGYPHFSILKYKVNFPGNEWIFYFVHNVRHPKKSLHSHPSESKHNFRCKTSCISVHLIPIFSSRGWKWRSPSIIPHYHIFNTKYTYFSNPHSTPSRQPKSIHTICISTGNIEI